MDDVQRLGESAHDRVGDGVIAAQDDRQGAAVEDGASHRRNVVECADDVGWHAIGVARVNDAVVLHLVDEIFAPRLGVVVAAVASGGETKGMLAQCARAETRTGHER